MTRVVGALEDFLRNRLAARAGDLMVVAFSGGPDSTALVWGLRQLAASHRLELRAAHLDHRLDPDSQRRAAIARKLASKMGVALTLERLEPDARPAGGESFEAYARRRRYAFLRRLAESQGARWIATAHHADDQAETVLLRLAFGSGPEGLSAIREVSESGGRQASPLLVRPLLSLRRHELRTYLTRSGLEPAIDPTNTDLSRPRNAIRWRTLPHLAASTPEIVPRLASLARAAAAANRRIRDRLRSALDLGDGEVGRDALLRLPAPLWPQALALLHRHAGIPYPPPASARRELRRQLLAGGPVGCDCGRGWRWQGDGRRIYLVFSASSSGRFTYTLSVPGAVDIPEIGSRVDLRAGEPAPWMFRGQVDRTALVFPNPTHCRVIVRNRRPGDRIQPLGSDHRQRLKHLLINRRVPRHQRDRLPLLVVDDEIAWVPGVALGERFRLRQPHGPVWIARLETPAIHESIKPYPALGGSDGLRSNEIGVAPGREA